MPKQYPTPVLIQINANLNEINPWSNPTVCYSLVDNGRPNVIYVREDQYDESREGFRKALEALDRSLEVIERLQAIVSAQSAMIESLKNGDNHV
jgi:hypothetical protein